MKKKNLVIALCVSIPSLPNFDFRKKESINYELANHLTPSGKGKRISDPRNNDWRNSKKSLY